MAQGVGLPLSASTSEIENRIPYRRCGLPAPRAPKRVVEGVDDGARHGRAPLSCELPGEPLGLDVLDAQRHECNLEPEQEDPTPPLEGRRKPRGHDG